MNLNLNNLEIKIYFLNIHQMLTELNINNILLIENLRIEFKNGFTAITGQTGAGKSILLDSISIILGKRAETNILRDENKQGMIIATFKQNNNSLRNILCNNGFINEKDDTIIIKKIITKNGSKIFINDIQTTVQFINSIANNILEIYSQFEQTDLFNLKKHLEILDNFSNLSNEIDFLKKLFFSMKETEKKYYETETNIEMQKKNSEYLNNLVNDIKTLNIKENEYDDLLNKKNKMIDGEKIATYMENSYSMFYNAKIGNTINKIQENLQRASDIISKQNEDMRKSFSEMNEELEKIYNSSQITEEMLADLSAKYYFNENEINNIEERISAINEIARKYKITPYELKDKLITAQNQLNQISISDETLKNLKTELEEKKKKYLSFANELSEKRKKATKKFENIVMKKLSNLKMDNAVFFVSFEETEPTEFGIDKVSFFASMNSGLQPLPIHKIASGGELSRFMLAFKSSFCDKNDISTIIFDEIDTGVSGSVAFAIGKEMKNMSKYRQVICITHSPQVAVCADKHFLVKKDQNHSIATTTVKDLTDDERINTIAEMLSNDKITDDAIKNAKTLLNKANQ